MTARIIISMLCMVIVSAADAADYDMGVAAYQQDDFFTALREFRPLAEEGHSLAQYALGIMHELGHGVPKDDQEAVRWYRMA